MRYIFSGLVTITLNTDFFFCDESIVIFSKYIIHLFCSKQIQIKLIFALQSIGTNLTLIKNGTLSKFK